MNFEFMTIDTPLPPCMAFPRALTGFPVSSTAKVMYCRMLDAMLSNGQEDENGILFVCFPVTAIDSYICRAMAKEKKPSYGGKQYSLQGAGGIASGAAEYTNAYRSSDLILVVHCSSFRGRPPGAALSSHRKGYLRWSSYRHVCC